MKTGERSADLIWTEVFLLTKNLTRSFLVSEEVMHPCKERRGVCYAVVYINGMSFHFIPSGLKVGSLKGTNIIMHFLEKEQISFNPGIIIVIYRCKIKNCGQ
jgi:hypothetical protein